MQLLEQLALALRSDDAQLGLAILKQDERRDAHDFEASGELQVVVDVDLADAKLSWVVGRDLVKHRRDHLARPAPLRPEVDQNRTYGTLDLLIERLFGQRQY